MKTERTKEEIEAFHEKEMHPEKTVLCPRCGTELRIKYCGNSFEIRCQTEGCFCGSLRGI